MNGTTLKALRVALGFSQQEAADMIAAVQMRTWRYWEDADRSIPADVIATIRAISQFKHSLIAQMHEQIESLFDQHGAPDSINLTYYTNLDDWMTQDQAEPIHWRPHCMAMAAIAESYSQVRLVKFHPVEYQSWLQGRADSPAMRGQWAATQK